MRYCLSHKYQSPKSHTRTRTRISRYYIWINSPMTIPVPRTVYIVTTRTYLFDPSMERTLESESRDVHSSLASDT